MEEKKQMLELLEKIEKTMTDLNYDNFNTAVDALVNAKNIYIAGVRSSAALVFPFGALPPCRFLPYGRNQINEACCEQSKMHTHA